MKTIFTGPDEYHTTAFLITDTDDGAIMSDCQGFMVEYEDIMYICSQLMMYAENNKEELENYNLRQQIELHKQMTGYYPKEPKPKNKYYIYLVKCGDRYKIGVSKDVNARIKQLDNRPYKVELVASSDLIEDAYKIEKELHIEYANYRIEGEWFNLPDDTVNKLIKRLETM